MQKKIRTSYLLYTFPYIFVSYSVSLLLSGPRYMIGAFPFFIGAAFITKNKTVDWILSMFCIMFLTILSICSSYFMIY